MKPGEKAPPRAGEEELVDRPSELPQIAVEVLSSVAAGAATGSIAGPVGAVAGAVIGGAVGAAAAAAIHKSDAAHARRDAELDEAIGVYGGDLGNPVAPGTKIAADEDEALPPLDPDAIV